MSMPNGAKELSAERRISEPLLLAIKKASLALPALSGSVPCWLLPRLPSVMETLHHNLGRAEYSVWGPSWSSPAGKISNDANSPLFVFVKSTSVQK